MHHTLQPETILKPATLQLIFTGVLFDFALKIMCKSIPPDICALGVFHTLRHEIFAAERVWHIRESLGQILALAFMEKSFKPFELFFLALQRNPSSTGVPRS